jgi:hypothetical protein
VRPERLIITSISHFGKFLDGTRQSLILYDTSHVAMSVSSKSGKSGARQEYILLQIVTGSLVLLSVGHVI